MKNDREKFKNEFKTRLYNLVLKIIKFVDILDRRDSTCRVISEQLVDSGTGMVSNYSEALVSSSKKDFTNYFHHCLKCCNGTKVWISLLRDSNKTNKNEAQGLLDELDEISKIFGSSLLTLKGKNNFKIFICVFYIFIFSF